MTRADRAHADLDALALAFNLASRELVGLSIRSILSVPDAVTVPQYRVLVVLTTEGPQSVGRIARHLGVNPSNASRLCDRLQRLDLISRTRSAADGRGVDVSITERGTAMVDSVTAARQVEIRDVLGALDEVDAAAATEVMEAFGRAARARSAEWPTAL